MFIVLHAAAGAEACCLSLLAPHLEGLHVDQVMDGPAGVQITADDCQRLWALAILFPPKAPPAVPRTDGLRADSEGSTGLLPLPQATPKYLQCGSQPLVREQESLAATSG
jgi:hypothetical protein